jgi:hypothetical protein
VNQNCEKFTQRPQRKQRKSSRILCSLCVLCVFQNAYPREALLEAVLRFVEEDLASNAR